jgi:hypothetical protein
MKMEQARLAYTLWLLLPLPLLLLLLMMFHDLLVTIFT